MGRKPDIQAGSSKSRNLDQCGSHCWPESCLPFNKKEWVKRTNFLLNKIITIRSSKDMEGWRHQDISNLKKIVELVKNKYCCSIFILGVPVNARGLGANYSCPLPFPT